MFKIPEGIKPLLAKREFKTVDIVRRLGIITANRVHLKNYPVNNPTTIFNPSILLRYNKIYLYARIILGYFTYASAIARLQVPLEDVYGGHVWASHYPAEIIVYPSTKFDLWGTEDPRVSEVNGKAVMVYCGRTINYFNPTVRTERTLPVVAVAKNPEEEWKKVCVLRLPHETRRFVVSDKDAFLFRTKDGRLLLFHRPHLIDEKYYLVISNVSDEVIEESGEVKEVIVRDTVSIIEPSSFESKLGWATPPVKVGDDEYIVFVHAVEREIECYRIFAMLMRFEDGIEMIAMTPYYIMEPRTNYEVFGDRPYTVFPCGIALIKDKLLISYGASDAAIGLAEIDLSDIMSHLKKV